MGAKYTFEVGVTRHVPRVIFRAFQWIPLWWRMYALHWVSFRVLGPSVSWITAHSWYIIIYSTFLLPQSSAWSKELQLYNRKKVRKMKQAKNLICSRRLHLPLDRYNGNLCWTIRIGSERPAAREFSYADPMLLWGWSNTASRVNSTMGRAQIERASEHEYVP